MKPTEEVLSCRARPTLFLLPKVPRLPSHCSAFCIPLRTALGTTQQPLGKLAPQELSSQTQATAGGPGIRRAGVVKLTQNRETWAHVNGVGHWNNSVSEKIINDY